MSFIVHRSSAGRRRDAGATRFAALLDDDVVAEAAIENVDAGAAEHFYPKLLSGLV